MTGWRFSRSIRGSPLSGSTQSSAGTQHHASDRPVFVDLIFKNRHSQMNGRLVRIDARPHPATTALSGRKLARAAINSLPGDGAGHQRNIAVRWSMRTGPAEERFAIFEPSLSRLRKIEVENLRFVGVVSHFIKYRPLKTRHLF